MVLGGKVNKEIVALINQNGGKAIGLTGKDGQLIIAQKMKIFKSRGPEDPPELIDIGMVGEVVEINSEIIRTLENHDFIPVIAPVGIGRRGRTYNINADLVAGSVAASLKAQKLILLTDVEGVKDKNGKLIPTIRLSEIPGMVEDGTIQGGMIPKVNCCRGGPVDRGGKGPHHRRPGGECGYTGAVYRPGGRDGNRKRLNAEHRISKKKPSSFDRQV